MTNKDKKTTDKEEKELKLLCYAIECMRECVRLEQRDDDDLGCMIADCMAQVLDNLDGERQAYDFEGDREWRSKKSKYTGLAGVRKSTIIDWIANLDKDKYL